MRFPVNKDKAEEAINRFWNGTWVMFPPRGTSPTTEVSVFAALKHSFVFPTLFCLFVPVLYVVLSVVILTDLSLRLYHRINQGYIYKNTVSILWELSGNLALAYATLVLFLMATFLLFRWAWNRRADRLNREASLSQPAVGGAPGVWPPPPNVSASADVPPRI